MAIWRERQGQGQGAGRAWRGDSWLHGERSGAYADPPTLSFEVSTIKACLWGTPQTTQNNWGELCPNAQRVGRGAAIPTSRVEALLIAGQWAVGKISPRLNDPPNKRPRGSNFPRDFATSQNRAQEYV